MYENRPVTNLETVCICDRCGREMGSRSQRGDYEWDERISLVFRGGYGSIFGDGNLVEGDFCQHCIKELLGIWLRVTKDDPCCPAVKERYSATRAYQDDQLRQIFTGRLRVETWLAEEAVKRTCPEPER